MHSIARIIVGVLAIYVIVTMVVFALISLPEGDPAQVFLLGNHAWVHEAKALNRGIDMSQHAAIRYAIWLGRVTRSLLGTYTPAAHGSVAVQLGR
jgi:ABC-type dipeptide/oligopeptide/nickel transport system permease component